MSGGSSSLALVLSFVLAMVFFYKKSLVQRLGSLRHSAQELVALFGRLRHIRTFRSYVVGLYPLPLSREVWVLTWLGSTPFPFQGGSGYDLCLIGLEGELEGVGLAHPRTWVPKVAPD